jgi:hypothetical protein
MKKIVPQFLKGPAPGPQPERQFDPALNVYSANFELLFSDKSWRNTWTHIVPGKFSLSPYTGLLFFEQSTGYAEVYETDGQGRILAPPLQTYSPLGGRAHWTHVIPGLFGSSGFTGVLLYDQPSGLARFLEGVGEGVLVQRSQYSDWRNTWTHIVPGFFTMSANSSLLFYSPSEGYGELWETSNEGGLLGTAPVQTWSGWRSTWTHIVAADFFWTPGYLSAPVFSDIFFYEASTGYGEMYGFDGSGLVPYPKAAGTLIQGATSVVAGNFGFGFSNVLLHDRQAGQLKIYSFLSEGLAPIAERETLSGLRRTFDLVAPGKFYMANPEDHWFNDGPHSPLQEQRNWRAGTGAFTDLLLYDRAAGLGETYLHEPIPPPAALLDAYISCQSSHDGAAAVASGSLLPGETLSLHISSLAPYTIRIYRQGYFGDGQTEQLITQIGNVWPATSALPISRTAYRDGAGWPVAASTSIPDLPSGLYLARVKDSSSPPNTVDVPFIVRAASSSQTKILLVIADTTYAAYNDWGGRNVYGYATATDDTRTSRAFIGTFPSSSALHAPYAFELSFERPVGYALGNSSQGQEIPMIQWLMRRGIPFDMCTARDLHFQAPAWPDYRMLMFVGHHEYWTWEMRDHVENFVKAGGGVGFFCGNTCWWQIRISPDGARLNCYKVAGFDPLFPTNRTTVNWLDSPVLRPETGMTGVSYYGSGINIPDGIPFVVKNPAHWAFQGISPPLIEGDWFGIYCGDNVHSVVGDECDRIQPADNEVNMQSPPNFTIASARDPRDSNEIATMGSFALGAGEVFNAATIIWALALSDETGLWNKAPEITQNVINRFVGGP